MRPMFLDVIAPTVSEMLSYFVRENTVFVILLFVVLLVIAVSLVNICVLKKNAKPSSKDNTTDSEEIR